MEKTETILIEIKGKGTHPLHVKYTTGLVNDLKIEINAQDLARLIELIEAPNLKESGIKISAIVTLENGTQEPNEVTLPEYIMLASPAKLREMGKNL